MIDSEQNQLDELLYKTNLYDFYESLLTQSQKQVYTEYYFNNLTMAEIASDNGSTPQSVNDLLRRTTKKLESYEKSLELIKKDQQLQNFLDEIKNDLKKCSGAKNLDEVINNVIKKIDNFEIE